MPLPGLQPANEAEASIRRVIQQEGRITFARFMELALFSPSGGYYSLLRSAPTGRFRDYFTAPMAHPLFGQLISLQLEEVWELLDRPQPFWIVEPGGGDGLLARDVLAGLQRQAPACFEAARYVLPELALPSAGNLTSAFPDRTSFVRSDRLPFQGLVGCVLSNELLDSFPVHRFQVQGDRLLELYVTLQDDRLVETLDEPSTPRLAERLAHLQQLASPSGGLTEGTRGEVCLALEDWVLAVAQALGRGVVLTIDYGDLTGALYGPSRRAGTLRCYYRHTLGADPFVRVGRQDMTAHVDFGALKAFGERAGLATLGYTTQGQFLRNLGADVYLQALRSSAAGGLPQGRLAANRTAMLELLRPEGMGNFRVLAQGKGLGRVELSGFKESNRVQRHLRSQLPDLLMPLLTPEHAPLLASRYPHAADESAFEHLWPWKPSE